jgi:hypothetical protein
MPRREDLEGMVESAAAFALRATAPRVELVLALSGQASGVIGPIVEKGVHI